MVSKRERVVVGLSGGVDSTLCASLLLEQGYEVIGVTLRLLPCEETGERRSCCGVDGVAQARAVAGQLGIKHYVADCHDAFTEKVLHSSWNAYAQAQTPNPCVLCNRHIKFGWLLDFAHQIGATRVATGHYARIDPDMDGKHRLYRGVDQVKDQTYFLFALNDVQLQAAMMPLGNLTKQDVRVMAETRGFVNAKRSESQDVCFAVDEGGFPEFMRRRFGAQSKTGQILDPEGRLIRHHDGLHKFTLGQRKGLQVALGKPAFVSKIDLESGDVHLTTEKQDLMHDLVQVNQMIWHGTPPTPGDQISCWVQTRYQQKPIPAIAMVEENNQCTLSLQQKVFAVTPGQCAVLYQQDLVLGGGWIQTGMTETNESKLL